MANIHLKVRGGALDGEIQFDESLAKSGEDELRSLQRSIYEQTRGEVGKQAIVAGQVLSEDEDHSQNGNALRCSYRIKGRGVKNGHVYVFAECEQERDGALSA